MKATTSWKRRVSTIVPAIALVFAACGSGGDTAQEATTTTTGPAPTATTAAPATTTTTMVPPTTTTVAPTTTVALTPLEELGFPVSDEWVVETVFAGIDSGTGGLAVDADGNFYQGDFGYSGHAGDAVYKITPDGTVETIAQTDLMDANTMTVVTADGTIYQSSYNANTVFKIAPGGQPEVLAEGIRGPTGIVVAADGTIFVEGFNSSIIHKILPDGTVEDFVFDRRFNGINGLTQGPDGTLYAADFKDGGLFSIAPDATVEKIFQFPEQTSHLVYLDGSLFVTSRGGFVVFSYDLETGDVEIIAGNGEPGDMDGRGGESSFGRPNAITVGPDGALYINHGDGQSNDPVTIRRITHQP